MVHGELRKNTIEHLVSRIHLEHLLDQTTDTHEESNDAIDDDTLLSNSIHETFEHLIEEHGHGEEHGDLLFLELLEDLRDDELLAEDDLSSYRNGFNEYCQHGV